MNNSTDTTNSLEIEALKVALEEARRRGPKLSTVKHLGKSIRSQLRLTPAEHAGVGLCGLGLSLHLGRPIAQTLVVRVALSRLMDAVTESLKNPATAARLKAEIAAVRAEATT